MSISRLKNNQSLHYLSCWHPLGNNTGHFVIGKKIVFAGSVCDVSDSQAEGDLVNFRS
jgi:hypothetical protein